MRRQARAADPVGDPCRFMSVGWIEAFVYAADLYCEDCGRHIRSELKAEGHRNTGDSEDYPQGPYPDGGGEADGPQHCGSNEQCENAMEFAGHKIGVWLGNPLTGEGVRYLQEMLADARDDYQRELHAFWACVYADYLEPEEEEEEEELEPGPEPPYVDPNQLPLPGIREKTPPLTAEQLGALERFAARHGRQWKGHLRDMWFHGAPIQTDDDTILYALRNTHGPSWLVRFRLPGSVREARGPEPVDDPFYVIQAISSDHIDMEFGFDDETVAIKEAKQLLREPWFESDYVRIITRDGELVWDSRRKGTDVDPYTWAEEGESVQILTWRGEHRGERVPARVGMEVRVRGGHDPYVITRVDPKSRRVGIKPAAWAGHESWIEADSVVAWITRGGPIDRHTLGEANVHLQRGERIRVRSKGPSGQPFEAFWYTVPDAMTPEEVALNFAQTGQPGMFIEIDGGRGLKWTFQQSTHAGHPAVTRVPHAPRRH